MPVPKRNQLVEIELELVPRETPENPNARSRLGDVRFTLDEIDGLYHAAAAAFALDASLPDLLAAYHWQQLPERPFDYKRARRFLHPELYFVLRELEDLRRPSPRLQTSSPLEIRHLSMDSPLQMVLEVPWVYIATTPAGFWLFVKALPRILGAAEDVILFPKRLRRRGEEEDRDAAQAKRDRIRAEREVLEEEELLSEAQRKIAERQIKERQEHLELQALAQRGEEAPLRLQRGELRLPPLPPGPSSDLPSSEPPLGRQ